jgi:hypothetical protein
VFICFKCLYVLVLFVLWTRSVKCVCVIVFVSGFFFLIWK